MDIADLKDNTNLVERTNYFVNSIDIVLNYRLHANAFYIDKLIPPRFDVSKKMSNHAKFVLMCSDDENLETKVIIDDINLIICNKQMSNVTEVAHLNIVSNINMRLPYIRLLMNLVASFANSLTICFDNMFTSALPNSLVLS